MGLGVATTRKWRRKSLKSLKTGSEMATPGFAIAGRGNRPGELDPFQSPENREDRPGPLAQRRPF